MIEFDINQNTGKHIHLIGIGGISMSAIAQVLLKHGHRVTGSDMKNSKMLDKLRSKDIEIYIGHYESNIKNPDLIVYTAAIKKDNPERLKGAALNIKEIDRAEMLGLIMKNYDKAIAVAGSHGKTTTTSLLSLVLEYSNLDPTILVGGELDEIGGNIKIGNSQHFITEACEYVESFLKFFPFIGVILNIDEDHLDYFRDLDHIKEAFKKFSKLIPKEGFLIANEDDDNVKEVLTDLDCNVITYGINSNSNFRAKNISFCESGYPVFEVEMKGKSIGIFKLSIPGKHNVYNALATIATAYILGIEPNTIAKNITRFKGIHRRFDILGEVKGCKIIDDYAHHPAEIKATLEATKNYKHNKIWSVFQPHTYSRTKALLNDFANSFEDSDYVIITDIYAAREVDNGDINSEMLMDMIKSINNKSNTSYMKDFDEISKYIYDNMTPGDIVLTMGAGDVYIIGEKLMEYNKIRV